jgi:hypothetical protein
MLYEIEVLEARRIAELAASARDARDRALLPVREAQPGEPPPARGERQIEGALGVAVVPGDDPAHPALREAIESLPSDIRRKLWAVMRTGCGDYAKKDWERAMMDADQLTDERVASDLLDEVDLHDRLMKGLYEIDAAEQAHPSR